MTLSQVNRNPQRNYASLQVVQNRIIRSIMKHSMSPKITAIEVLMGIPPIDIYCSSIEIKIFDQISE